MNVEQTRPITQFNAVVQGDCLEVLRRMPAGSADFVLTDPPYLVRYRSRDGRRIQNDADGSWLLPAFREIFRVLRRDSFCISFYGWSQADKFIAAWRRAGFHLAGHLTFPKSYRRLSGSCGTTTRRLFARQRQSYSSGPTHS
jgi:adenine-specific DNA-methyltransferase